MTHTARIGVVLSSGGGRGVYAHTGFLLALQKLGIEVSAIAGCSAGALVGGIAASGADLNKWSDTIASVKTREYWTPDSWLEFICMMASAAMPLLYRPVQIEGGLYTDGAVIELAPTEAICCKHGLDALIVHHSAVHREGGEGMAWAMKQPWSLIEILYLLLYRHRPWYLSDQPLTFHRCPHGCGASIIVLECDLPDLVWPLNSGGSKLQAAAMYETLTRLQPFAEMLIGDPRRLPLPRTGEEHAATQTDRLDVCHEPEHGKDHHEC
ncbi:MAG: patatin-like phospholipase family protein [Sideroxyarcus sp.]|nr:patatin-like phospholipase family protein [Sideroxyarcus sp.]